MNSILLSFKSTWFFGILGIVYLVRGFCNELYPLCPLDAAQEQDVYFPECVFNPSDCFYYIVMTVVSLGLFPPFFREPGSHVAFIDLFFMAVSTVSVTGLTTFPINDVFNDHGVILLEVLFQVGGLGIMMISTFFAIVSRRKISLKQRQLIMTDMNQPKLSGIVRMIRTTFTIILVCQLVAGTIFAVYFHLYGYYDNWRDAIFMGFIKRFLL